MRAKMFQNICNGKVKGEGVWTNSAITERQPKCHFVHHFIPYLNLGPFHIEVKFYWPFRTIIHDFFTEREMDWMLTYSKPRLTGSREGQVPASTKVVTKSERRHRDPFKTAFTVAKAVTTWFSDIKWNETEEFYLISRVGEPLRYEPFPLFDPDSFTVEYEVMSGISRRIELVTHFNVTKRHAASPYQTTNYGLSGMVVSHMDPWGYEMGVDLVEDRATLIKTGDYIATFMGWFEETKAGGGTAFNQNNFEGTVEPTKGSAAFWINLSSCHIKDERASHGGCPVLKGSKWILNKWIYSWDQWKDWPCELVPQVTIGPFDGMST